MALLGYARVSTNQQNLDIQIKKLIVAGVENSPDFLFTDKASGKNDDRGGLKLLLTKARKGDAILISKLDRLGRNTRDMINSIEELDSRGIAVRFLDDGISTEGAMGKMVVTILAAVAQAERARILERTNEGRKAAMEAGVKFGRMRTTNREAVLADLDTGMAKTKVAEKHGISRQQVYKILKATEQDSQMKE
ncbi:recombinase family protein [uncultured Photobacterium sp.]|uniref:recombinase family protein n=1 Tax=uncultured Photobacterium sp. TaxID=173973 RepID=UPI0026232914|nr:recombinase family protein [uncultured Photobacterium sp.]